MTNPLNLREIAPLDRHPTAPNVLTVDVEDWYHVNYTSADPARIDTSVSRVCENTAEILEVLAETGSRGTFFFLGSTAEQHPDLVRAVASADHEIACHSFHHALIYNQTPEEFCEDVQRAVQVLSGLAGKKIIGFRAPSCSITEKNPWALDILCECGFRYDSSIFPIKNYMYGVSGFPVSPCRLTTSAGNRLIEIPLQAMEFGMLRIPFGGGIYLRLLPAFFQRALVSITHSQGRSFMLYFHPSDIDRVHMKLELSLKERFFNDVGRRGGRKKILRLLRDYRWVGLAEAYARDFD